ncbi:MAG: hypothetical protein CML04_05640 [Pseudozobellia sp.]|nr:hypothetical protein [Pseudozobellia sp.]MBG47880.1 hypothetical protein [Pseudozobellia sp.]|tara:strand:+ start:137 stop:481 length:345 start_codon:yes stop_codon:yes gene_type:complete
MASFSLFESIALSFPEAVVEPHFEKISFRVQKKIFATYDDSKMSVTVKLAPSDQERLLQSSNYVSPVPSKWGKQGWTILELPKITESLLRNALQISYLLVAPKKLAHQVKNQKS